MTNLPIISVIIPAYNRAQVIADTLDAILAQSYPKWECIVVDDGSTDNTYEIAREYEKKDSRFRVFQRPENHKPGGCGARNFGFLKAEGKYIKWLDSDDLIEKELLEKEMALFNGNPFLQFVFCRYHFFDTNLIYPEDQNYALRKGTSGIEILNLMGIHHQYILTGSYTISKEMVFLSGLWNEELKINQDGEFLYRILSQCKQTSSLEYIGFLYRIDNNDKITSNYNSKDKARLKLKSWQLIEVQIKLRQNEDLLPYITGFKNFLYKYHLHIQQEDIIVEFSAFFKNQIKREKRKRIKARLLLNLIKKWFSDFC